jgi:cell division protein FtsB
MTTRLSKDDYKRPKKTYTESLSTEEIKEKLKDYKKIDDISKVPVNSHLRYFSLIEDPKTKKFTKVFRIGGFLKNKDNWTEYVILCNGLNGSGKSWSVNTQKSIFFQKMSTDDIVDKYEEQIQKLKDEVYRLKKKIHNLEKNNG